MLSRTDIKSAVRRCPPQSSGTPRIKRSRESSVRTNRLRTTELAERRMPNDSAVRVFGVGLLRVVDGRWEGIVAETGKEDLVKGTQAGECGRQTSAMRDETQSQAGDALIVLSPAILIEKRRAILVPQSGATNIASGKGRKEEAVKHQQPDPRMSTVQHQYSMLPNVWCPKGDNQRSARPVK